MKDIINKDLEKYFSAAEIGTIKKFVGFVADSNNQAEQSKFSVAESDAEIREEVLEWLSRRHSQGLRPRSKRD
jgi:molybdopterin synthase catalytic subunit